MAGLPATVPLRGALLTCALLPVSPQRCAGVLRRRGDPLWHARHSGVAAWQPTGQHRCGAAAPAGSVTAVWANESGIPRQLPQSPRHVRSKTWQRAAVSVMRRRVHLACVLPPPLACSACAATSLLWHPLGSTNHSSPQTAALLLHCPAGLSWSDVLLGALPNVYLYAANNPSESIIAKRRGYGTIVSHNVPPYGRAGAQCAAACMLLLVLLL